MTSLHDLISQQRQHQYALESFIQGLEESDGEDGFKAQLLEDYVTNWECTSIELEAKINAYGHTIRSLEAKEEYYKAQTKYFTQKARSMASKIEFLRKRVEHFVSEQPGKKYATNDFNLRIQKNQPSLKIDDSYQGDIPDEYIKDQVISEYVDKTLVKQALKAGVELPFASLEVSESLRGV